MQALLDSGYQLDVTNKEAFFPMITKKSQIYRRQQALQSRPDPSKFSDQQSQQHEKAKPRGELSPLQMDNYKKIADDEVARQEKNRIQLLKFMLEHQKTSQKWKTKQQMQKQHEEE